MPCIKNVSSKLFHILIQKYIEFDIFFSPVDLCLNFYFFPSEIDRIDLRGSKLNQKKIEVFYIRYWTYPRQNWIELKNFCVLVWPNKFIGYLVGRNLLEFQWHFYWFLTKALFSVLSNYLKSISAWILQNPCNIAADKVYYVKIEKYNIIYKKIR